MKIINTFIVCRITNTVFKIPKFYKVHEIEVGDPNRTALIKEDERGEMETITIAQFNELKTNMEELGL